MSEVFPDPSSADENGIVCAGGSYSSALLLEAYLNGIFPWPHEEHPILWFSPDPRGILAIEDLHLPRSLLKWLKKNPIKLTFNKAFSEVLNECKKQPRRGQTGTWITEDLQKGYEKFHQEGFAYSCEAWLEGKLVAGLYGVNIKGFVSAESIFNRVDNAAKALLYLFVKEIEARGIEWVDIQMLTPLTEQLGGKYIPRCEFLKRLRAVLR